MNKLFNLFQDIDLPILTTDGNVNEESIVGCSGYIDQVEVSQMFYPIMKGYDQCRRPFLSIKCLLKLREKIDKNNEDNEDVNSNIIIKQKQVVGTFFQRYSNSKTPVCYGTGYHTEYAFFDDSCIRSEENFDQVIERLKKVMKGETIFSIDPCKKTDDFDPIVGHGDYFITIPFYREPIQKELNLYLYKDLTSIIMSYI